MKNCWFLMGFIKASECQHFFDHWSSIGLQMPQCITLDDHWNKPNFICLSSLHFSIMATVCVQSMLTIYIFPLYSRGSSFLSMLQRWGTFHPLGTLISRVAPFCLLLTMYEMFSCVHIRLLTNVQQFSFFLLKMVTWMLPALSLSRLWCWEPCKNTM